MNKNTVAIWSALILALGGVVVAYVQNSRTMVRQEVLVQMLDQRVIPQIEASLSELVKEIGKLRGIAIRLDTTVKHCCKTGAAEGDTEPGILLEDIPKLSKRILTPIARMREELFKP